MIKYFVVKEFFNSEPSKALGFFMTIFVLVLLAAPAGANDLIDMDRDGVPDKDELEVYGTDPRLADTDGDGFSDWIELNSGYSPHTREKLKLEKSDQDSDGLSDRLELNFKTNLLLKDTDGDSHSDGEEIKNGYDPLNKGEAKLAKRIEINIGKQELSHFLGGVRMGTFPVSSGIRNTTPKGHFKIINKQLKAWSPYGLWMPFWMGLGTGKFGLHELPIWPNGYREGENHLGVPVSHGCIRLGIGPAEQLYNWTPVGTGVFIY